MTSGQVVETSVNVTNNSPSRDYSHPDDQTTQTSDYFIDRKIYGKKIVLDSGERENGERNSFSKPCRPERQRLC